MNILIQTLNPECAIDCHHDWILKKHATATPWQDLKLENGTKANQQDRSFSSVTRQRRWFRWTIADYTIYGKDNRDLTKQWRNCNYALTWESNYLSSPCAVLTHVFIVSDVNGYNWFAWFPGQEPSVELQFDCLPEGPRVYKAGYSFYFWSAKKKGQW